MRKVGLLSLLLVAIFISGYGRLQIDRFSAGKVSFKEVFNLPPGRVLRQLDLGWHTLAADLLFIRANIYYGHHILGDEELPWLDSFVDAVLDLDPDFKAMYFWGSLVSRFRKRIADTVSEDLVRRSTEILKRGYRRFPDDYRFPFRLAYNYYYELGQVEEALPYFEAASRMPGAPDWLAEKLSDLYRKRGQRETAVKIVEHLIATTEDPVLSQGLHDRLLDLLEPNMGRALIEERKAIIEAWQRDFPFVSFDLYLLLRPQGP